MVSTETDAAISDARRQQSASFGRTPSSAGSSQGSLESGSSGILSSAGGGTSESGGSQSSPVTTYEKVSTKRCSK